MCNIIKDSFMKPKLIIEIPVEISTENVDIFHRITGFSDFVHRPDSK
jgi:hypothetical protein